MIKPNEIILYHANCTDGLTAAHQHFCNTYALGENSPDKLNEIFNDVKNQYIPLGHNMLNLSNEDLVKHIEENSKINLQDVDKLQMLDFVLKPQQINYLLETYPNLHINIIDHHISVKKDMEVLAEANNERVNMIFDTRFSAAALCHWFFKEQSLGKNPVETLEQRLTNESQDTLLNSLPLMIRFVHERDTFQFKHEDTKAVSLWLNHNIKEMGDLFKIQGVLNGNNKNEYDEILVHSNMMKDVYDSDVDSLIQPSNRATIDIILPDHSIAHGWMTNCIPKYISDVGYHLARVDKNRPFAILTGVRNNPKTGAEYSNSIRGRDDFDATVIAKIFGGGGHAAACAFSSPLDKSLKTLFDEHNYEMLKQYPVKKLESRVNHIINNMESAIKDGLIEVVVPDTAKNMLKLVADEYIGRNFNGIDERNRFEISVSFDDEKNISKIGFYMEYQALALIPKEFAESSTFNYVPSFPNPVAKEIGAKAHLINSARISGSATPLNEHDDGLMFATSMSEFKPVMDNINEQMSSGAVKSIDEIYQNVNVPYSTYITLEDYVAKAPNFISQSVHSYGIGNEEKKYQNYEVIRKASESGLDLEKIIDVVNSQTAFYKETWENELKNKELNLENSNLKAKKPTMK